MHTKPWKVIQTVYIVTFQTITCISVPHEVRLQILPHCHIPCNSDDFFFICTVSTKKKKKGEVLLSVTTGGDLQLWDETGNLLCKQDKDCRLWLSLAIGEQSKSGLGESQPFENSNKN